MGNINILYSLDSCKVVCHNLRRKNKAININMGLLLGEFYRILVGKYYH